MPRKATIATDKPSAPALPTREITEEIQRSYLEYAMSVIIGRALPDVRDAIGTTAGLPLTFLPDPLLSGGQVQLRMGEAETRIDLEGVIALIGEAVATYLNTQHEDTPHG